MMLRSSIELTPNPLHQGTRNRTGDQVERQFEHELLALLGDCRLLWLPSLADVATATDKSRYARTLTFSESLRDFDAKPTRLGSGVAVRFNGTDEEADTPDADGLSFGDGAVDKPFSVVALVNPDNFTGPKTILAKWSDQSGSTDREWYMAAQATSGRPIFSVADESANAFLARRDLASLSTGTWTLLVGTYDGSAAMTGIRLYKDGTRVDDSDQSSGSYTAMEAGSQTVDLSHQTGTSGDANFFDGSMALVAVVAKELSPDEVWAVKSLANSFFGLSL